MELNVFVGHGWLRMGREGPDHGYYLRKAELDRDVLGEGKNPSTPRR